MLFFILILIIAAAAALARQIRIVPHQMTYVIERFGKYYDTWEDGLHVKMPIADRIVKKVSKKERVYDFPPQDVITKDNVTISIDSVVYASVFDPQSYTYSIDNPILGLQNLTATTLRSIIGSMELDQTLSSRSEINQHMRTVLDEATDGWGIRVSRVEVKNIKPPAEIEEVMTKQMRAERERRQTVLEAQAHKVNAGIDDGVLRLKSIEAMKDVANGRATKIFIPNDLTGSIGAAGVLGEAFREYNGVPGESEKEIRKKCVTKQLKKDACLDGEKSRATYGAAMTNANIEHDLHDSAFDA